MAFLIGAATALAAAAFAAASGFDRSRAFYPTVLFVIASYYVLFAVMGGAPGVLGPELALFGLFAAAAVLAFRWNLWLAVLALAAHGVLDLGHAALIRNPGTPAWWPPFCMAYDLCAAACLSVIILRRERPLQPQ